MSLQLNDNVYIIKSLRSVPIEDIPLIVKSIPAIYFSKLFDILSEEIKDSPFIHFYLTWLLRILQIHGELIKYNNKRFLPSLRLLIKAINFHQNDLMKLVEENSVFWIIYFRTIYHFYVMAFLNYPAKK